MDWNSFMVHSLVESHRLQEEFLHDSKTIETRPRSASDSSTNQIISILPFAFWKAFTRSEDIRSDPKYTRINGTSTSDPPSSLIQFLPTLADLFQAFGIPNSEGSTMKTLSPDLQPVQNGDQVETGHGVASKMRQLMDTFRPRSYSESSSAYQNHLRNRKDKRNRNPSGRQSNGRDSSTEAPSRRSVEERDTTSSPYSTPASSFSETLTPHKAAIGPAEFLEMYRSRANSEPRPEARLAAVSNLSMRRLRSSTLSSTAMPSFYRNALKRQQMVLWRDKETGSQLLMLPSNDDDNVTRTNHVNESLDRIFSKLFETTTCYEVMPNSFKLVVFDSELSVKRALFGLLENDIRAAPIWDSRRNALVGMLTVTDFINVLRMYRDTYPDKIDRLEESKISSFKKLLCADTTRRLISITPDDSLTTAVARMRSSRIHRLPVIDPERGNIIYTLTYKRLLKFLHTSMEELSVPLSMSKSVEELGVGSYEDVATVYLDTPVLEALRLLTEKRISCLPVIDEDDKLMAIYSKADVMDMASNKTYNNLDMQVGEALRSRCDIEIPITCKKSETLQTIISRLVSFDIDRLIVTDNLEHVHGIISISDILNFLVPTQNKSSNISQQDQNDFDSANGV